MTLQQMKYFQAVAEYGSISEAAKALYAAQSSVSAGSVDIGILFITQSSKDLFIQKARGMELIFNHLLYDRVHAYLKQDHPLTAREKVMQKDLKDYPFITYDRSSGRNSVFTEAISAINNMKRLVSVTDRAAACQLLKEINGFAIGTGYLPKDAMYEDIVAVPIEDGAAIEIGYVVKSNYILPEEVRELLDILYE